MEFHLPSVIYALIGAFGSFLPLMATAGSVIEWDATKVSGNWCDGENWGGVAPTGLDAAKFTVASNAVVTVNITEPVVVTNIWVYGGGRLILKAAGATEVQVRGNSNSGASDIGSGRQSVYVTDGSTLVIDGVAVTNTQTSTYHDLQMNSDSKLIITNGAEFIMPVRMPAIGAGALSSGKSTVLVTGEGSKFGKYNGSSQIAGIGSRIICEDGASFEEQFSWKNDDSDDLVYAFSNNASFKMTTTMEAKGKRWKILLDGNSTGTGGNSLTTAGSNGELRISNGSKFTTTSFRWGYASATDCLCHVTNATLSLGGYFTLGGNKWKSGARPATNRIVIAKDALLDITTKVAKFEVGYHSDDDLLYIDGGAMTNRSPATIGCLDCTNTVFKLRGETASATFLNTLAFDNKAKLAVELPLPKDRPLVSSTAAVTINDGTKFEVTLPEDFEKGTYTILSTTESITGTIAGSDVSVVGKGMCRLTQDGSSIQMTVKPRSGFAIIYR